PAHSIDDGLPDFGGFVLHPSRLRIILGNLRLSEKAEAGDVCFGTIDSWLIYNLNDGRVHATDATNASRTLLYNIDD
ncbi:FGGY family carbohydrate kinase, partial [Rhizobium ruizarguesonis]